MLLTHFYLTHTFFIVPTTLRTMRNLRVVSYASYANYNQALIQRAAQIMNQKNGTGQLVSRVVISLFIVKVK